MPDIFTHIQNPPSWGPGVAAWRRVKTSCPACCAAGLDGMLQHRSGATFCALLMNSRINPVRPLKTPTPLCIMACEGSDHKISADRATPFSLGVEVELNRIPVLSNLWRASDDCQSNR